MVGSLVPRLSSALRSPWVGGAVAVVRGALSPEWAAQVQAQVQEPLQAPGRVVLLVRVLRGPLWVLQAPLTGSAG